MRKADPTKPVVVYADDDEDDLQLVSDALSPYVDAINVRVFASGSSAYAFLLDMEKKGEKPCLVILDINMPGMGGRELLSILRSIPFFADVPVLLFTTSKAQQDYGFALRHNAGFITKPTTYQQIALVPEQFLRYCAPDVRERIQKNAQQ
jgi:CheY-like chemotaxis protein